jgi:hypothetical protein
MAAPTSLGVPWRGFRLGERSRRLLGNCGAVYGPSFQSVDFTVDAGQFITKTEKQEVDFD